MATKTKKQSVSETNEQLLLKSEALKKIHEHNRDYLSVSLTLPLGNPALKEVHTNQWLFTDLPREFDLANWTIIADALNSTENRSQKYVKNRWYIEGVDISVDASGKAEMKLTCNAFASSYESYTSANKSMLEAYTQATTKTTTTTTKTNKKNTSNAVKKSGTKNTSLKGGWGKWVDNWVKKVCGNETDPLKKAKLIDKEFKRVTHWSEYYDAQKTGGVVSRYEKAYNSHYLNCADGANILCAFFNSAGITAAIMHTYRHYIVRLTIKGTYYWTDCSASNGQLCNKAFNVVYGYKGGSYVGTKTK